MLIAGRVSHGAARPVARTSAPSAASSAAPRRRPALLQRQPAHLRLDGRNGGHARRSARPRPARSGPAPPEDRRRARRRRRPTARARARPRRSARSVAAPRDAARPPAARAADCVRSIASVYWVRSLVPIEKKSASCANWSASSAADAVSTMMPTGDRRHAERQRALAPPSSRAARHSASVAIIGNMIATLPARDARRIARSCVREELRPVQHQADAALAEERVRLGGRSAGRAAACRRRRRACG